MTSGPFNGADEHKWPSGRAAKAAANWISPSEISLALHRGTAGAQHVTPMSVTKQSRKTNDGQ